MENKVAIELIVEFPETIEQRILQVLDYIIEEYDIKNIEISEIEATGYLGNKLTDEYEIVRKIAIKQAEFLQLLKEDGQIIELNVSITTKQKRKYVILVVRGSDLNILSNDFFIVNKSVVGQFKYLDLGLFNQGIGEFD